MPWMVLIVCALGVVMAACATTGARSGDAPDARFRAMAELEPLIGAWEGAGYLRSGADALALGPYLLVRNADGR